MMACTTSIGPGATNLVTAAATGARQSPAGAVPARRHLRLARARSGAAADRGFPRRHGVGQRLLPAGVALLRPHRASRAAAHRAAARDPRADRSRAVRPGHARAAAGRADDGVRLSRGVLRAAAGALRRAAAGGATSSPTRRRVAARGEAAADRRRRRRAVRAGDATRCARSPRRTACRSPRRRRARARCRGTIRCSSARSASPARRRRTRWRATPTSCSPSARGCRTSRPARTRCSRRRRSSSINVNAFDARKWRGVAAASPMRGVGLAALSQAVDGWQRDAGWQRRARRVGEALARRRRCA